ncbi:MAG: hypothetical protein HMLKMBBP_01683 [Planctomycetes bacterium]|nr:hypothetical protein [Planctomycetota bacterium]
MSILEFSKVRLKVDRPALGLHIGDVGVVVEVHQVPRVAYEVEFIDEMGRSDGPGLAAFEESELEVVPG